MKQWMNNNLELRNNYNTQVFYLFMIFLNFSI
jgi:hypothetical protein